MLFLMDCMRFAVPRIALTRFNTSGTSLEDSHQVIISTLPVYSNQQKKYVIEGYGGWQTQEEKAIIAEWASRTKPEGCDELSEYALANCTVQSVSSLEKCTVFFFGDAATIIMDFYPLQVCHRLGMVPINEHTIRQIRTGETVWVKFPKKIGEYDPGYYMGTILAKLGADLKELDTEDEDEVSEMHVKFFFACKQFA
jgi:hypothetical protein